MSRAYGAEVMFVGDFHVNAALEKARELGQQPGHFCPSQFDSEWNVEENRVILGPEILAQLPEGVVPDALVAGVGTGGTLLGVGQAFREANPDVRLFAMEPAESRTILCGEVALHRIEGISDGFVPGIFQRHGAMVDEVTSVSSDDAVEAMHQLARGHGLFCGPSSGAHLVAARRVRERHPGLVSSDDAVEAMHQLARGHGLFCGPSSGAHLVAARRVRERHPGLRTVVTLFCDEGEKYLQDYFMGKAKAPPEPSPFV
ncbi:pyridoxal-phosphate dependent enzyme [Novilysobacter longmucuonensis]|uniref:pyridoxal-phosphate dependent enzyme n=1 Tax=Novilysobacter longmucuonensis TaxID=3098603 RepID=UPI003F9FE271